MSLESKTTEYLLLFRGTGWDKGLSPEETQQVVTRWYAWFEGLLQAGTAKGGQPLEDQGKIVSGKGGRMVADGPFAESKEAIAGYFLLQVASLEEAIKIAQQCPALEHGVKVEVRPVAPECTSAQRLKEQMIHSVA